MVRFHSFILLVTLIHIAIGSNLKACDVVQRSIKGYPKMQQALYNILKNSSAISIPDIEAIDFILNITSFAQVKRDKNYISGMTPIKTLTGHVKNRGKVRQKMFTPEYSESYAKSSSLTTTKSTESSNEIRSGVTVGAEASGFFWKFKKEFSISYTRRWGESNSASKTETNTTTITITAPLQEVVVNPYSKINVTTQVFSFRSTVEYLIDFRLNNSVGYHFEANDGHHSSFINMTRFENDIKSVPYDNDDAKLVCSNSECFLKDVPAIMEETGYHIETIFGEQEPIV